MRRIERIRPNEEVIVPVISEPLQQMFEESEDAKAKAEQFGYDCVKRFDNDYDKMSKDHEASQSLLDLAYKAERLESKFWYTVKSQYKIYGLHIAIRDGYCIVRIKPISLIDSLKII